MDTTLLILNASVHALGLATIAWLYWAFNDRWPLAVTITRERSTY